MVGTRAGGASLTFFGLCSLPLAVIGQHGCGRDGLTDRLGNGSVPVGLSRCHLALPACRPSPFPCADAQGVTDAQPLATPAPTAEHRPQSTHLICMGPGPV